MKKISTLFVIHYTDNHKGEITEDIRPENMWINDIGVKATQKFDGAAAAIFSDILYKRWDNKKGKVPPEGAIECQKANKITGHHPYWVICYQDNADDKYFYEAYRNLVNKVEGTYELCGSKVQSNPENINGHKFLKHGSVIINLSNFSYESIKTYLSDYSNNIEGIVFHHPDGRMCKIRKSDFLIKRCKTLK